MDLGCHSWINVVIFNFCELGQLFFDDLRRVKVIFMAFRFSFVAAGARKVYFSLALQGSANDVHVTDGSGGQETHR